MASYRPKTVQELLGTGDSLVSELFAGVKAYASIRNTFDMMDYRQEKKHKDAESYTITVLDEILEGMRLPENKNSRTALQPFAEDLKRVYNSGIGSVATVNKFNQVSKHLNRSIDRATELEKFHQYQREAFAFGGKADIQNYFSTADGKVDVPSVVTAVKDEYSAFETIIRENGWWGSEEQNMKDEMYGRLHTINNFAGSDNYLNPSQQNEIERMWEEYLASGKTPSLNERYESKINEVEYFRKQILSVDAKIVTLEDEIQKGIKSGFTEEAILNLRAKKQELEDQRRPLKERYNLVNNQLLADNNYLSYDWRGNERGQFIETDLDNVEDLNPFTFFTDLDKNSQKEEDAPDTDKSKKIDKPVSKKKIEYKTVTRDDGTQVSVPIEVETNPEIVEINRLKELESQRKANQKAHGGDKKYFLTDDELIEKSGAEWRAKEEKRIEAEKKKEQAFLKERKEKGWTEELLAGKRDGRKIPSGVPNIIKVQMEVDPDKASSYSQRQQYQHPDGKKATKEEIKRYETWHDKEFATLGFRLNNKWTILKNRIKQGEKNKISEERMKKLRKELEEFEKLHKDAIANQ